MVRPLLNKLRLNQLRLYKPLLKKLCLRKLFLHTLTVLPVLFLAAQSSAQTQGDKPDKNPFGQPDILKYRPPVQTQNNNALSVDENNVPELKLTATLISVSEPMVIVNDRLLHIGEEIEGMKLKLIDEGRAVFLLRGKSHVFTIDDGHDTQTR